MNPSGCPARRAVAAIAAALGCASAGGGQRGALPPATSEAASFSWEPHGIEVLDDRGQAYEVPFLGGFNVPRPQLVDIDADGDLDLFVQEYTGQLMFLERVHEGAAPVWRYRSEQFQNLAIGEWSRFVDVDGDGDMDLLAEEPFSYIRYFRNDGSAREPAFVLAVDSLRDADGGALFADRQNIPQILDLDCNGKLDLMIGRVTGTVMRYEEVGRDERGNPRFRLLTERFEDIEIVAQIGSLHGANTMAFHDFDGDGDVDLFWGDFFESGLLLIENTGSCRSPSFRSEPTPFPLADPVKTSGYNAPVFGDLDADGDTDLLVGVLGGAFNPNRTTRDNLIFLEGEADAAGFSETTRQYLTQLDVGSESIPVLHDLDGDGDLDLLVSNKIEQEDLSMGRVYRFENVGTVTSPRFESRGPWLLQGLYHFAPAFGDLDGDGRDDMLVGAWRDNLIFYRNTGSGTSAYQVVDSALVRLTRGSNATPALVDIDDDGDLDLFVGEASGDLNFYRNTGLASEPVFTLESDKYLGIDAGRRSVPAFLDVDGDGDWDMVLGRERGGLLLYRNRGSRTAPAFEPDSTFSLLVPPLSTPTFGDIDDDGDVDLFTGGISGGIRFYENRPRTP